MGNMSELERMFMALDRLVDAIYREHPEKIPLYCRAQVEEAITVLDDYRERENCNAAARMVYEGELPSFKPYGAELLQAWADELLDNHIAMVLAFWRVDGEVQQLLVTDREFTQWCIDNKYAIIDYMNRKENRYES